MDAHTAFTDTQLVYVSYTRAWSLLTDWDAAPVWMPGVDHMYAEGPPELGMAVDFIAGGHERTATITALDPGCSMTLTMGTGDVQTDYRYALAQDGGNVRISLTVDVVVSEELADMAPGIRESVTAADGEQLRQFKRYAEAAP